jgi:HEAT repeat protein
MLKRLEAIRKATQDPEPAVRQAAVRSLSAVEEAMDIERLTRLARNGKKQARLRALYALRDCGSPTALDALGALVRESDDPDARSAAASCLGQRGAEAAPHLRDALDDPERSVAEEAMRALVHVGAEGAAEWITDAARRRQPLEDAAIEALGALGDDRAADFLTEFIRNGSADQQYAAAQALARLGPEVAEDTLIATAEADDANLRRAAVEALGELRPPRLEAAAHAGSSAGA